MKIDLAFQVDSPLATRGPVARGFRLAKCEPRTNAVVAPVFHRPGPGPAKLRAKYPAEFRNDVEAAAHIYATKMIDCPHYVFGQEPGQILQVCPEAWCARGVGVKLWPINAGQYAKPLDSWLTKDTQWWKERWPTLTSPFELAGGKLWLPYSHRPSGLTRVLARKHSCNANTIHIEGPNEVWERGAWANAVVLVADICQRHVIPITREHILTHSDCHPLARSKYGQPWDPSPRLFTWEQFAKHAKLEAK